MSTDTLLVEIGTEELPPKALRKLMQAFASNLDRLLDEHRLIHDPIREFATPRRIAALVPALALAQGSREVDAKGPPVGIAFDDAGEAKPPAIAFAKKCGVGVGDLGRTKTDKGEWLSYRSVEKGLAAAELLPGIIEQTLKALPIPRRMLRRLPRTTRRRDRRRRQSQRSLFRLAPPASNGKPRPKPHS